MKEATPLLLVSALAVPVSGFHVTVTRAPLAAFPLLVISTLARSVVEDLDREAVRLVMLATIVGVAEAAVIV